LPNKSSIIKFNCIKGDSPVGIDGDRERFWQQIEHQAKLVLEEAQEQYDAAVARDIVEVVDGACDVDYLQTYLDVLLEAVGVDLPQARELVADNNNQKYTTNEHLALRSAKKHSDNGVPAYAEEVAYEGEYYFVVKRKEDGKVLKLIGHQSPKIADAIPEKTFKMVGEKDVAG